jgi:pimeloyl-ACP methyl ester carboxylesterase
VQKVTYMSSADDSRQSMMFYKPQTNEPRQLLVGLHSWSESYEQEESVIYAEWCIANDSELVIGDVMSAIEYAKENARVDVHRIYAIGWSGGGHLGLLLAGRAPQIWAGVSAWVPISDLNAWYEESRRLGTKYGKRDRGFVRRQTRRRLGGGERMSATFAAQLSCEGARCSDRYQSRHT